MSFIKILDLPAYEQEVSVSSEDIYFPIPNHPNHEISIYGHVRNKNTGQILKTQIRKSAVRRYVVTSIGRVHRLLMSAIEGRTLTKKELVCHRDGNTMNNQISNLRIGSAQQNALDKIKTNTNGRKLRNSDVYEIRALARARSRVAIAAEYDITAGHVRNILSGKRWFNLP